MQRIVSGGIALILVVANVILVGCTTQEAKDTSVQAIKATGTAMVVTNKLQQIKAGWPAAQKALSSVMEGDTYTAAEKEVLATGVEQLSVQMDKLAGVLSGTGGAAAVIQNATTVCSAYYELRPVYTDCKAVIVAHKEQLSPANRVRLSAFAADLESAGAQIGQLCDSKVGALPASAVLDMMGATAGIVSIASQIGAK